MSGGYFDYTQRKLLYDVIEPLGKFLENPPEWTNKFTPETWKRIREGYECACKAFIYIQRIDWLFEGDDGVEDFHERLKDGLDKFETEKKVPDYF